MYLPFMLLLLVYPAPHQVLVVVVACGINTVGYLIYLMH
jgi:NADPH:quinone reductase-like Zn-dependent oxidoreductase